MCKRIELEYILLEIPEFEKNIIASSVVFFNIFGINSEKPVVRLDNFLFEGKWYYYNSSSFFFSNKKKSYKNSCNNNHSFFTGNSFFRNSSNDLNFIKNNNFKLLNVNCIKKRLRLFRIPLVINIE